MYKILPIAHVLSKFIMLFSCMSIFPALVSVYYRDGTLDEFLLSIFAGLAVGLFLWAATRRYERELKARDGFILVCLMWFGFAVTATTPFMLHFPGMSFTDACFEALSTLTTTGATTLTGLDDLPPSINFWRHFLSWLGGMGIIVLAVAVLPMLGIGGMQLYKAEMPGLIKDNKLAPRIASTAKSLWIIYTGLTILCTFALWIVGMPLFDAVCHAFTTISLGGTSTKDASIGFYNSVEIEMVISFFMVLSAMNFALHFIAWREGSVRVYFRDTEAKSMLVLLAVSIVGISYYLHHHGVFDFMTALRHVSFNLISIATACGFASTDFGAWPTFAPMWILVMSCFTACAGSTGSGIKMARNLVLIKQTTSEITRLLHPNAVVPLKINGKILPNQIVLSVLAFVFVYIASIILLGFIMMISGLDYITAFTAIVACMNNAGPGLGEVGPASNYSGLNDFQTWICSLTMVLGRLEIFTLLILLTPTFWRK